MTPSDSVLLNGRYDPMGDGSSRPSSKGKGRASQNGDVLAMDLDSAEGGLAQNGGAAYMQMQLVEQQVRSIFTYLCIHLPVTRTRISNPVRRRSNPSSRR